MPELPEVETVRIQLLYKVVGKTISTVKVFSPRTVNFDKQISRKLKGKKIAHIDRVGKLLIFSFVDSSNLFILAHLKMTGQFFYVASKGEISGGGHTIGPSDGRGLPGKHTRSAFYFTDNSALFFNDMRLFGYTKLATASEVSKSKEGYGPEPIDPGFDCEWFVAKLKKRKALIKAALLDQSFVAGLGNIYVDEALWRAKVRPTRRANSLTKTESLKLCKEAGAVMVEAIAIGGTTFKDFAHTDGNKGNFTEQLQVYGRQGLACSRCGTLIKKIRVAGRGTHFCPGCQK